MSSNFAACMCDVKLYKRNTGLNGNGILKRRSFTWPSFVGPFAALRCHLSICCLLSTKLVSVYLKNLD